MTPHAQPFRWPLTPLSTLSIAAAVVTALLCALLAISIGMPDGVALLGSAAALVVCAGLVATGIRWTPALGTLLSVGLLLAMLLATPYPAYHLAHPKPEFLSFALDVLIFGALVVTGGAMLGATVQSIRDPRGRALPPWLPSALSGAAGIVVGALLIAALAQPISAGTSSSGKGGEPTVHLGPGNFSTSSVRVPVGAKLVLVDDGAFPHVLAYGAWDNGAAHAATPPLGAPPLNDVRVAGGSLELGPFAAPGTYHIYCLVHPGMNLTILVQ
jgi:plastocyanin